jgi:hypothetical protein
MNSRMNVLILLQQYGRTGCKVPETATLDVEEAGSKSIRQRVVKKQFLLYPLTVRRIYVEYFAACICVRDRFPSIVFPVPVCAAT